MEEKNIQTRLEETSRNCLEAYSAWEGQKKDAKAKGDLHAAIHDLRKVSSRLEIELALSEREQMTSKPLPIPSHRSTTKGDKVSILDAPEENSGPVIQSKPKRRRSAPRKKTGE